MTGSIPPKSGRAAEEPAKGRSHARPIPLARSDRKVVAKSAEKLGVADSSKSYAGSIERKEISPALEGSGPSSHLGKESLNADARLMSVLHSSRAWHEALGEDRCDAILGLCDPGTYLFRRGKTEESMVFSCVDAFGVVLHLDLKIERGKLAIYMQGSVPVGAYDSVEDLLHGAELYHDCRLFTELDRGRPHAVGPNEALRLEVEDIFTHWCPKRPQQHLEGSVVGSYCISPGGKKGDYMLNFASRTGLMQQNFSISKGRIAVGESVYSSLAKFLASVLPEQPIPAPLARYDAWIHRIEDQEQHYHPKCSDEEAEQILLQREPGSYLTRPGSKPGTYVLSYMECRGCVEEVELYVSSGQLMAAGSDEESAPLTSIGAYVGEKCGVVAAPVSRRDVLLREIENPATHWHMAGGSAYQVLKGKPVGAYTVQPNTTPGYYKLSYIDDSGEVLTTHFTIASGQLHCEPGPHDVYISLDDLLLKLLPDQEGHFLPCGSLEKIRAENRARLKDLFTAQLRSDMAKKGEHLCKVSRRSPIGRKLGLADSYFVTDRGELLRQHHANDCRLANGLLVHGAPFKALLGKGGLKVAFDLEGDSVPMARARAHDWMVKSFDLDQIQRVTKAFRTVPSILSGETLSYTSEKTGKLRLVWILPRMQTDLSKLLKQQPRDEFPLQHRLLAARQLVNAVAEMHARGWAHLDIKPDNCFCNYDRGGEEVDVRLADLDTARDQKSFDQRGGRPLKSVGTAGYRAPELERDAEGLQTLEEAMLADRYSLGVTLFHLYHGGAKTIPKEWLGEERPPLDSGDSVDRLVYDLLSFNPADRPSMDEVSRRLASL